MLSIAAAFAPIPAPLNDILGLVLSALIGIAIENIRHYQQAKQKLLEDNQLQRSTVVEALKALLHDSLETHCVEAEDRGYITYDEIETINNVYKPYHALGGNGAGTDFYQRALQLPHKRSNQNEET